MDLLEDFPILESSTLVKYGNDLKGLVTYTGWFFPWLSCPANSCCCLPYLFSMLGEMAPEMTAEEVR